MHIYIYITLLTHSIRNLAHNDNGTHHPVAVIRVGLPVGQILVRGVPAVEYRHERYDARRHPRDQQQERHQPFGDQNRILERLYDRVVPVHADATQVQYGCGGEVHVTGVPHVAHKVPEHPFTADLLAGVERHGHDRHQHVGER